MSVATSAIKKPGGHLDRRAFLFLSYGSLSLGEDNGRDGLVIFSREGEAALQVAPDEGFDDLQAERVGFFDVKVEGERFAVVGDGESDFARVFAQRD